MKVSKVFFGLAIMVSLAFIGCPMSDPGFELIIPPEPPIAGMPTGRVIVQRPGYEKYWPMGGYVEVEMYINEGMITEVFIFLSHDDPFLAREIIEHWGFHEINGPGWMVERNTVDLDIIAGATATSIAVLDAAVAAVEYIRTNTQPQPMIFLDRELIFMPAETTETLHARVMLLDVFDLVWSSSDENIATVSEGVVTAGDRNGMAIITVSDHEGRASAATLVVVHGAEPYYGMTRVRRVEIGGRFDPLEGASMGATNVWLVDDSGYLAMSLQNSEWGGAPLSSWHIMRESSEPNATRFALRNVVTRRYLNVSSVTRGDSNLTFANSQPRVSPFQNTDYFFWELVALPTGGYNIVSYGTQRTTADAANPKAGALSNRDFPEANWPDANEDWPDADYAVSRTGNEFISMPCGVAFPFKHVQWRFDSDWETALADPAFVFDIITDE